MKTGLVLQKTKQKSFKEQKNELRHLEIQKKEKSQAQLSKRSLDNSCTAANNSLLNSVTHKQPQQPQDAPKDPTFQRTYISREKSKAMGLDNANLINLMLEKQLESINKTKKNQSDLSRNKQLLELKQLQELKLLQKSARKSSDQHNSQIKPRQIDQARNSKQSHQDSNPQIPAIKPHKFSKDAQEALETTSHQDMPRGRKPYKHLLKADKQHSSAKKDQSDCNAETAKKRTDSLLGHVQSQGKQAQKGHHLRKRANQDGSNQNQNQNQNNRLLRQKKKDQITDSKAKNDKQDAQRLMEDAQEEIEQTKQAQEHKIVQEVKTSIKQNQAKDLRYLAATNNNRKRKESRQGHPTQISQQEQQIKQQNQRVEGGQEQNELLDCGQLKETIKKNFENLDDKTSRLESQIRSIRNGQQALSVKSARNLENSMIDAQTEDNELQGQQQEVNQRSSFQKPDNFKQQQRQQHKHQIQQQQQQQNSFKSSSTTRHHLKPLQQQAQATQNTTLIQQNLNTQANQANQPVNAVRPNFIQTRKQANNNNSVRTLEHAFSDIGNEVERLNDNKRKLLDYMNYFFETLVKNALDKTQPKATFFRELLVFVQNCQSLPVGVKLIQETQIGTFLQKSLEILNQMKCYEVEEYDLLLPALSCLVKKLRHKMVLNYTFGEDTPNIEDSNAGQLAKPSQGLKNLEEQIDFLLYNNEKADKAKIMQVQLDQQKTNTSSSQKMIDLREPLMFQKVKQEETQEMSQRRKQVCRKIRNFLESKFGVERQHSKPLTLNIEKNICSIEDSQSNGYTVLCHKLFTYFDQNKFGQGELLPFMKLDKFGFRRKLEQFGLIQPLVTAGEQSVNQGQILRFAQDEQNQGFMPSFDEIQRATGQLSLSQGNVSTLSISSRAPED